MSSFGEMSESFRKQERRHLWRSWRPDVRIAFAANPLRYIPRSDLISTYFYNTTFFPSSATLSDTHVQGFEGEICHLFHFC